jgi:hypothetical protein
MMNTSKIIQILYTMNSSNFTKDKYLELKELYEQAIENNKDTITIDGQVLLTNYAKYLLEYLAMVFK